MSNKEFIEEQFSQLYDLEIAPPKKWKRRVLFFIWLRNLSLWRKIILLSLSLLGILAGINLFLFDSHSSAFARVPSNIPSQQLDQNKVSEAKVIANNALLEVELDSQKSKTNTEQFKAKENLASSFVKNSATIKKTSTTKLEEDQQIRPKEEAGKSENTLFKDYFNSNDAIVSASNSLEFVKLAANEPSFKLLDQLELSEELAFQLPQLKRQIPSFLSLYTGIQLDQLGPIKHQAEGVTQQSSWMVDFGAKVGISKNWSFSAGIGYRQTEVKRTFDAYLQDQYTVEQTTTKIDTVITTQTGIQDSVVSISAITTNYTVVYLPGGIPITLLVYDTAFATSYNVPFTYQDTSITTTNNTVLEPRDSIRKKIQEEVSKLSYLTLPLSFQYNIHSGRHAFGVNIGLTLNFLNKANTSYQWLMDLGLNEQLKPNSLLISYNLGLYYGYRLNHSFEPFAKIFYRMTETPYGKSPFQNTLNNSSTGLALGINYLF